MDELRDTPPEDDRRMRVVAVRVLATQVLVLLALWAFQRYFTAG